MAADKKPWVEYNWLGENCGLKVSNICLGTMTFGKPMKRFDVPGNTDKAGSIDILNRYVELGGNFLDTANIYTNGESEEIIGSWLSSRDRGSIVVATKVGVRGEGADDAHPNDTGLSRSSIMHNVEHSLKRLQTDYIDLYYTHFMDKGVKIEETFRTLDDLVRSGKVRYVGLSNYTGSMLQKVKDYSHFLGFTPPVTLQQEYNLVSRESDIEVVPVCHREGISIVPYSPLGGGLLAGKFKRDDQKTSETLAGTRLGWVAEKPSERAVFATPDVEVIRKDDNFWALMDAVEAIGKQHGKSQAQVSLRWLLQKDYVPSVIIGAKTIKQLDDNMAAGTGWKLTDEQMKQLDDLSRATSPIPRYPYGRIDLLNSFWNRKR